MRPTNKDAEQKTTQNTSPMGWLAGISKCTQTFLRSSVGFLMKKDFLKKSAKAVNLFLVKQVHFDECCKFLLLTGLKGTF